MINLIKGDCIEVMKSIPEQSIDLTVTSPPYDNLRTYNNSSQWSFEIFKPIALELFRVTKDGGIVVWVVGDATINGSETGTSFKQALYFKSIGFRLHDTMIYYSEKPPLTHNRYEQKFEYMFVFSKLKPKTFNPIREDSIHSGRRHKPTFRQTGSELKKFNGTDESGTCVIKSTKIKGNVWKYCTGFMKSTTDREAFEHPAIFPEKLVHDHIISWSNEGDTVFDPFLGSGTTGKMARVLKRKFIGIEKDETYFEIAKERLK
jgi:DNA modification methylase